MAFSLPNFVPCDIVIVVFIFQHIQLSLSDGIVSSFVFGDSLVDAGNNDYLFTLSKADTPPYGIDFSAFGGQPTGRFTNGRTIADLVGQALGAVSFPPPYLSPTTRNRADFGGVNYASGASGILDETGALFIGRVPMSKQIDYFNMTRSYMVKIYGEKITKQVLEAAIFSITAGSNDLLNFIEPRIPFFQKRKIAPSLLQDFMVANMTIHLRRLHMMGARRLVVVGVGPLGCIPFVKTLMLLETKGGCSEWVNELIQGYNSKLKNMLIQMNQELGSEAKFVYANSYDIFLNIIHQYKKLGFENADDACCGGNFPPFICFGDRKRKVSSRLCEDRSKYVFWDAYHPTEATNMIIADELLDGDQSVSFPINIRQLYQQKY